LNKSDENAAHICLSKRRHRINCFLTIGILATTVLPLHAQIDTATGRNLKVQAQGVYFRMDSDRKLYANLIQVIPFQHSIDMELISADFNECEQLRSDIQGNLESFYYDKAIRDIESCNTTLTALDQILREDLAQKPSAFLNSKKDDFISPSPQIPEGDGLQLRSTIYNEINFAERLTKRAGVPVNALFPGEEGTPCISARFSLQREIEDPNFIFLTARRELRLLNYQKAHEIALSSYTEAQNIIAICDPQDRRLKPWKYAQ